MSRLRHVAADTSAEVLHEILERDGALVIGELAPLELIDRIAGEMAPLIEATPGGSDDFSGRNTRRTGALVARSPASRTLVRHPLILDVAGRPLHRARAIQRHLTQIISDRARIAETLDDDLLRLLGYQIGADALGYIDDVRDPIEAIRGGSGSMSSGDR